MAAAVDSIMVDTSPSKPAKRAASSMARRPHTPTCAGALPRHNFDTVVSRMLGPRFSMSATTKPPPVSVPPPTLRRHHYESLWTRGMAMSDCHNRE
eukprot:scaffold188102_cov45-Attheya_sp.AAC.1